MWLSLLVSKWSERRTANGEIFGPLRIHGEPSGDKEINLDKIKKSRLRFIIFAYILSLK
jgi:hypothetical protein